MKKIASNKKSNQRKAAKIWMAIASTVSIIAFLAIIAVLVVIIVQPVKVKYVEGVKDRIIQTATLCKSEFPAEEITSVSIGEDKLEINGEKYYYFPNPRKEVDPIKGLEEKIPSRLKKCFNASKKLIIAFVQEYFDEPIAQELLKEIEGVRLIFGDFTQSTELMNASFVCENGTIYCNPEIMLVIDYIPTEVIIFTILHEWVHAVDEFTSESNEEFLYTQFNEAMTDLIAMAIYEEGMRLEGYHDYYPYAWEFIAAYQEDAIDAYFFGYDSLFESGKLTKEKMQIVVFFTDVSGTEIDDDGYSDLMAYEEISGLFFEDMIGITKGLFR